MVRRLPIEGAVIGSQQIFGEGQAYHHLLELDPEAAAQAFAVLRQPVGRLKSDAMFGRCHRKVPRHRATVRRRTVRIWGCRPATARLRGGKRLTPHPEEAATLMAWFALTVALSERLVA